MLGINYDGLRKKKTYDELIDYVMNKQEKIQYPDRTAKILRNSPQLSNLLDGDGEGLMEMEEQQKRQVMEVEKEHILRRTAGPSTGAAADVRAATRKTITARHPSGKIIRTVTPGEPPVIPMDVDDDDEINIIYNMDVDAAINKQEENESDKKSKIAKIAAQNLGYVVPQSTPFLFPSSSSSSASTVAPSSTPAGVASSSGAGSSSSAPQNMVVDRPDGVKRDNDDDSSNVKKSQRKGRDSSFTKKEKNLLALTDAEQSKDIPKSMDTPKLVKVSKEVFKDTFNSMKNQ